MGDLFETVGEDFFKPLTSLYKKVYWHCLQIIYESYRTELSYGVDRDSLVRRLEYYFDDLAIESFQFDDGSDTGGDSRGKAAAFLRKLKECGWIETEIGPDQRTMVLMPAYAVAVVRNLEAVSAGRETEYQSELSAIYSLLTSPDLLNDPYPQVLKPVYDRTMDLFTGLKQLSGSIKKYIDGLTAGKAPEEIVSDLFAYHDEIGSQAFHRLFTSDNVSRFRNVIYAKLNDMRNNPELFEKLAWGWQRVEGEPSLEEAEDRTRKCIQDVVDCFRTYDDIVSEIVRKHNRFQRSAVSRARFALLNTNNMEGKISTILRCMAEEFSRDEEKRLDEDASDEICALFNLFPQGFVSDESIKSVPVSRRVEEVEEVFVPGSLTEEERRAVRMAAYEKNKNRFSRKNICAFVDTLLKGRESIKASEIHTVTRRDMIQVIFISLYGQNTRTDYQVVPREEMIEKQGFRYRDFEIRRK